MADRQRVTLTTDRVLIVAIAIAELKQNDKNTRKKATVASAIFLLLSGISTRHDIVQSLGLGSVTVHLKNIEKWDSQLKSYPIRKMSSVTHISSL